MSVGQLTRGSTVGFAVEDAPDVDQDPIRTICKIRPSGTRQVGWHTFGVGTCPPLEKRPALRS